MNTDIFDNEQKVYTFVCIQRGCPI